MKGLLRLTIGLFFFPFFFFFFVGGLISNAFVCQHECVVLPASSFIKYLNFKQRPSIGFENQEVPKFQRMITCKVMPAILKTLVPSTLLQSDMPRLSSLIFVNVLWYHGMVPLKCLIKASGMCCNMKQIEFLLDINQYSPIFKHCILCMLHTLISIIE